MLAPNPETADQAPAPAPAGKYPNRFKKGQSGNPGGKPKELKGVMELARKYAPEAMETLRHVAKHGSSEAARVSAAVALLDRGFGKPQQSLDASITTLNRSAGELNDDELAAIAAGGGAPPVAPSADPSRSD